MKALLWKDLRLNRTVLLVAAGILAAPYLLATAFAVNEWLGDAMPIHRSWVNLILGANHFCLMFSFVVLALAGANTFAGERTDRSAEFLAYLPPSREQVATSKAVIALAIGTGFWLINLLIGAVGMQFLNEDAYQYIDLTDQAPKSQFAAVAVLSFGVAWLASSCLSNTGSAAVCGLAAPAVVFLLFQGMQVVWEWPAKEQAGQWFRGASLTIGMLVFVAGFQYFIRRVEP